ncbi:hypothetical protein [Vibrio sp. CyArs1]|uniref:hypothetical protein n=1 Tax=Vibrio sp. CyArs1 TaxID=2682577 RepID=UPI001F070B60|nr:hypothetical protein [Vibrio sp. CyArs1]
MKNCIGNFLVLALILLFAFDANAKCGENEYDPNVYGSPEEYVEVLRSKSYKYFPEEVLCNKACTYNAEIYTILGIDDVPKKRFIPSVDNGRDIYELMASMNKYYKLEVNGKVYKKGAFKVKKKYLGAPVPSNKKDKVSKSLIKQSKRLGSHERKITKKLPEFASRLDNYEVGTIAMTYYDRAVAHAMAVMKADGMIYLWDRDRLYKHRFIDGAPNYEFLIDLHRYMMSESGTVPQFFEIVRIVK